MGSSGANWWARVKCERTKSMERLLRTMFYSGHLQHERKRPDIERKSMNSDKAQWKESELTTLISEPCRGTNIKASKLTFYNVNRNRRLRLSASGRVATDPRCVRNWTTEAIITLSVGHRHLQLIVNTKIVFEERILLLRGWSFMIDNLPLMPLYTQ